ncbi:MAG: DUF6537 domain-containing protein, partial [Paracoccaceae bacterium]|nr:DUF6537 domain-containing protein [Paracoccaceae bacterium]
WIISVLRLLAWLKPLRGTALDPFGHSAERRMERALIAQFEADMGTILPAVSPATQAIARELAELPLSIRGFGPVKAANAEKAAKRRDVLLAAFHEGGAPRAVAAK